MSSFLFMTVLTAFRFLNRNRMRSVLTTIGIIIGVGSVIAMVSIGEGAKSVIQSQVASMGTNMILILPGATSVGGVRGGQGGAVTLTVSDAVDLKKKLAVLRETGWAKRDVMQVVYGNQNWNVPVNGISPSYLRIRDWSFTSGGPFTEAEMEATSRVALIGQTVVDNLFTEGEDPLGKMIRIKNVPFQIIGILAPKGQSPNGNDQDDIIFIPFTTAERKVVGTQFLGTVGALFASTERTEDLPEAVEDIRRILRERHRLRPEQPDDFTLRTQVDIGRVQEGTGETLTIMMFSVASISLLVGGIGIMNILLVSVTERTREIGIRMAIGAKRQHILVQFLAEAIILSMAGGMLGVVFGIAGARATTLIAGWPTIISIQAILVAFLFSVAVGLIFGMYPANKASRLNPIDALRYE
ncbi:MAG: ABC transporter permease [Nitrospiraceae bacterium]|nr:ABC transporter permease [Nitrospiraceae bacterium]